MKKIKEYGKVIIALMLITVIAAFMIWTVVVKAEPVDRYHSSWYLIRETANEDGAAFAAVYDRTGVSSTVPYGDFGAKDSSSVVNGGPFQIKSFLHVNSSEGSSSGQKWMFVFCGEARNGTDDTFSFNLVGWSKTNGMMQNICEGSTVLGTQAVAVFPDGGDALAPTFSDTGVTYTHATKTFTDTTDDGSFAGAVAGMIVRVTGSNLTSEMVTITTVTDVNVIICTGVTSSNNNTDSTVQGAVNFWADTITLDETTKWQASGSDPNTLYVINSGDNEIAGLVVDLTGLEWIQFVIYDADGATGEEAGNITIYGRRY